MEPYSTDSKHEFPPRFIHRAAKRTLQPALIAVELIDLEHLRKRVNLVEVACG